MEKRAIEISLETAKEWYKGDNEVLKNLSLQAFNKKELQLISCVRSWEEFCTKSDNCVNEYFIDSFSCTCVNDRDFRQAKVDRNLLATKEDAEAVLALIQLKRLRDQWWEALDWKPDFTDEATCKYTILLVKNEIKIYEYYFFSNFLSFPTKEIAEDFLKCFEDLINKAKELI